MSIESKQSEDKPLQTAYSDSNFNRKKYEKPTLTPLQTLDIQTGNTNVPESSNGLLSSS
jgi:hypothetical protein